MKALTYTPTIAKYVAARANLPGGGALALEDVRPPRAPGPDWVHVRPRLSGICGSDLALVHGKASLHLATLTSHAVRPRPRDRRRDERAASASSSSPRSAATCAASRRPAPSARKG